MSEEWKNARRESWEREKKLVPKVNDDIIIIIRIEGKYSNRFIAFMFDDKK